MVMAGLLTGLGGFNNTSLPWPLNPQGILQKLPHTTNNSFTNGYCSLGTIGMGVTCPPLVPRS
jgi:hypothetical protein